MTALDARAGRRKAGGPRSRSAGRLNLDAVARVLDPDFDPNAAFERKGAELMRRKLEQAASPQRLMAAVMEAKEITERFPGQVNKVMEALAEGEFTLNLKGFDEQNVMRGPTETELFGYPAFAIVLFIIAALAGLWLLVSIQLSDLPQRRRRRRH